MKSQIMKSLKTQTMKSWQTMKTQTMKSWQTMKTQTMKSWQNANLFFDRANFCPLKILTIQ